MNMPLPGIYRQVGQDTAKQDQPTTVKLDTKQLYN